jgi:maleylpyruvate isomerase
VPARLDQVDDPRLAASLLTARRGTAYFARKLAELGDEEFDAPSLVPGWTRRHVIAHVGYNARALTRLLEWATTGIETPMYAGAEQRLREIENGASLQPIALRHLVAHSNVHLNVEWRDLSPAAWQAQVRTAQGRTVPAGETAWMRSREVWIHAVDLNNGGSYRDFPPDLLDDLLADVTRVWRQRGTGLHLTLHPTDRISSIDIGPHPTDHITGSAADLARWATGRGTGGLAITGAGTVPAPPRWL